MKFVQMLMKPFRGERNNSESAMSIIEIIIVIALIGGLMSVIITNVMKSAENAQVDTTKIAMQRIGDKLTMYRVDNNRYPSTEQGLEALINAPSDAKRWRGPYIEEEKLTDPWGSKFEYESDGRIYKIRSAGPNNSMGDEDDVSYPEDKAQGSSAAVE
jgi:general secretion pathway protein G